MTSFVQSIQSLTNQNYYLQKSVDFQAETIPISPQIAYKFWNFQQKTKNYPPNMESDLHISWTMQKKSMKKSLKFCENDSAAAGVFSVIDKSLSLFYK